MYSFFFGVFYVFVFALRVSLFVQIPCVYSVHVVRTRDPGTAEQGVEAVVVPVAVPKDCEGGELPVPRMVQGGVV